MLTFCSRIKHFCPSVSSSIRSKSRVFSKRYGLRAPRSPSLRLLQLDLVSQCHGRLTLARPRSTGLREQGRCSFHAALHRSRATLQMAQQHILRLAKGLHSTQRARVQPAGSDTTAMRITFRRQSAMKYRRPPTTRHGSTHGAQAWAPCCGACPAQFRLPTT